MIITLIFVLQLLALLLAWVGKRERAIIIITISMITALGFYLHAIDTVTSIVL